MSCSCNQDGEWKEKEESEEEAKQEDEESEEEDEGGKEEEKTQESEEFCTIENVHVPLATCLEVLFDEVW